MSYKVSGYYTRAYDFDTELEAEDRQAAEDAAIQWVFDTWDNVDHVDVLEVKELD